jgi:AcrR family transcriptional regulator
MSVVDRPTLNRERIAAKALELSDEHGLSGLSMRKLGAEFGVEAMSLYHYVTNKSDLLDAVLDLLFSEIELPDVDDDDWEAAIRLGLRSFNDVLMRHEAALELFSSRQARSETAFRVLHWAHQRFQMVGLSIVDAHHALHVAVSFVMGHAANELGTMSQLRTDETTPVDDIDDPVIRDFVSAVNEISGADMFATGLDVLVDGLRTRFDLP